MQNAVKFALTGREMDVDKLIIQLGIALVAVISVVPPPTD